MKLHRMGGGERTGKVSKYRMDTAQGKIVYITRGEKIARKKRPHEIGVTSIIEKSMSLSL